jgi:hypothetical protein
VVNVDQRDLWENENVEEYSEVDMAKEVLEVLRLPVDENFLWITGMKSAFDTDLRLCHEPTMGHDIVEKEGGSFTNMR